MKISFCTTCMGRLDHLSQTIFVNISNSSSYGDREFIILNYGDRAGMHKWVVDNLSCWIESGIVKYYRTKIPLYFIASHAKNIAHRQASGDILCNLDADNYLVEGYCELLFDLFSKRNCVVSSPSVDMNGVHGSCGKIAVRREHFYSVNGYDEDWNKCWGWDDTNFEFRVRALNSLEEYRVGSKYCRVIEHSNEMRVMNFVEKDIHKSNQMSYEWMCRVRDNKEYIANKDRDFGYASDLSSDLTLI